MICRVGKPSSYPKTKIGYDRLLRSSSAQLSYVHVPYESVYFVAAGGSSSEAQFRADATAARAHALLGLLKNDQVHIDKAITIINDWASTMKGWTTNMPRQPQLETAWALPIWISAADILSYYKKGQPGENKRDVSRFDLPKFKEFALMQYNEAYKASKNISNWGSSANLALISYGVFVDDIPKVLEAINNTKTLMGHMAGLKGFNPETCRDTVHPQYTNVGVLQVAEIAYNYKYKLGNDPALDLYSFLGKSGNVLIPEFLEYYSKMFTGAAADPCNGVWTQTGAPAGGYSFVGEWDRYDLYTIAYHHYLKRTNSVNPAKLAEFKYVTDNLTPTRSFNDDHFILWGLLTHSID